MNIQTVEEYLEKIKMLDEEGDDEIAHEEEDNLIWCLINSISENTCDDPAACCTLALASKELGFARWCA